MKDIVSEFGNYLGTLARSNPTKARKRVLQAYRVFGFYQKHFPQKELPKSSRYLANSCMNMMVQALGNPSSTALVSLFTPCELLYAFSLQPLCAEMFSTYLNGAKAERTFIDIAEENGISETYCSYHKVLVGAIMSEVFPRVSCIVNTSLACDANNLSFKFASHELGLPQYYIDVPYESSEDSIQYVKNQLIELTHVLENFTGKKLEENKLKEITDRSKQTLRLMNETISYRSKKWLKNDLTSEMYEALMMHTGLGSKDALEYAKERLEDFKNTSDSKGLKILWMHSNPFWQEAVKERFNYLETQHIVATELSYEGWITDTENDDPYTFMAKRLVYSAYNGSIENRIQKTLDMAKKCEVDGIICFCHWGCKQGSGCANYMCKRFNDEGYPVLILNGDGVDRLNASDGQIATRCDAFFEMLEENKK